MIIAIDGPAASGKGTLARRIAAHYGLAYLDTGLLYRAVARDLRAADLPLDDPHEASRAAVMLDPATLTDTALRDSGVGDAASVVARIPEVRAALIAFQRAFARRADGAVLDGRDIGTVVVPDAHVKIFVVADTAVRARRRYDELAARGDAITYEAVLATIKGRDERDSTRAASPMKPAPDAHLLDTTHLDIEAAFTAAIAVIGRSATRSR